ncbi:hypothetical protein MCEGKSE7_00044 [Candidatus Nanopelagicaceae bacterium]
MQIVYVHLNSRIPIHLFMNLRRTRVMFPGQNITLISNVNQRIPKGIKLEIFKKGEQWYEVENRLGHPKNFRNNFWMTSLGRFIALVEYQNKINDSILHIESDVIISQDFPVNIFEHAVWQISYPILSNERGIASILFLPDKVSSNELLNELQASSLSDPFTSDMLILGNMFRKSGAVSPLPIGPNGAENYRSFLPNHLLERWEKDIQKFGGVFDGWDIGGFFFGTDPRNARGRSYLQRDVPSEFSEIRKWNIKYSKSRDFIELENNNQRIPIFCLHLTSKQLSLFKVNLPSKRIINLLKVRPSEYSKFYLRIFVNQAFQSLLKRSRFSL